MSETFVEVERILREICNWARALQPETQIVADLGLDSIGQLDLVVALENRFEIALELDEDQEVITIAHLVDWIDRERGRADADG